MELLVVYVALVVIDAFVSYGVGYMVESAPSSGANLLAFLLTCVLTLRISWFIAVRLTVPKSELAWNGRCWIEPNRAFWSGVSATHCPATRVCPCGLDRRAEMRY